MVQETTQEQTDQESVVSEGDQESPHVSNSQEEFNPERAFATIRKLQETEKSLKAEKRTEKERAEKLEQQVQAISKALGISTDGSPDPEKLQQELQRMQTQYRRERVRNAFYRAADKLDADSELAWAVLQTSGDLEDLDVDSDDLDSQIIDSVKALLDSHPKLKKDTVKTGAGGSNPPNGQAAPQKNPWSKDTLNLTEQGRIIREDPALAQRLQEQAARG